MTAPKPSEAGHNADLVRHLKCSYCLVYWDFTPPRWLGEPWTREQADRLLADHMRLAHEERTDPEPPEGAA